MGGKYAWARKHIHLFLALLITVGSAGCTFFGEVRQTRDARIELQRAHDLADKGNFEDSIAVYERVAALLAKNKPADEALFYLGLAYAHPDNRNRDLPKASEYLHRVAEEFPDGAFSRQATALSAILNAAHKSHLESLSFQTARNAEQVRRAEFREPERLLHRKNHDAAAREYLRLAGKLQKTPEGEEALLMAGILFAHPDNQNKNYPRALELFSRLVREYPESSYTEQAKAWIGTIKAIEALKTIGIDYRERKLHGR